jgi:hypothetical protein
MTNPDESALVARLDDPVMRSQLRLFATTMREMAGNIEVAERHIAAQAVEIERLRGVLENLADAADAIGVKLFDTDTRVDPVEELQNATIAARAALALPDAETTK